MPRPRRATPLRRNNNVKNNNGLTLGPYLKEKLHGYLSRRLASDTPGSERELHGHGLAGPDHYGASTCARSRKPGGLRTGGANRVAYASAGSDALHALAGRR